MNIEIYPYKLSQRTEFSKFRLENLDTDKDITKNNADVVKKILEDYNNQLSNTKDFFNIDDTILTNIKADLPCDNTEYVFIPDGVTRIGKAAFQGSDIGYVNLPCSLKIIERFAFRVCNALQHIKVPESVECLEGYVFSGCESLKTVILPNLDILEAGTFNDCQSLSKIELPDTLISIGLCCFNWCTSLKEIIIPDSVEEFGDSVFNSCFSLKYVKLPKNLKRIEDQMFHSCISLENINLPDTVKYIGSESFASTERLKSFTIPRDLTLIGHRPFYNSAVKTLIFKHDLKSLSGKNYLGNPNNLLEGSKITKLVIDKNVSKISPNVVGYPGGLITKIDYLGTKEEFEIFKKNNKKLFDLMPNLRNVNFEECSIDPISRPLRINGQGKLVEDIDLNR